MAVAPISEKKGGMVVMVLDVLIASMKTGIEVIMTVVSCVYATADKAMKSRAKLDALAAAKSKESQPTK